MKYFIATALTLGLAAAAAAPASLQKRVAGSITLYPNANFGGAGTTINFNINEATCVASTLPSDIDNQASSVRLSAEHAGFNCRLMDTQNCVVGATGESTWFFDVNVPDLSNADYGLDNRASSVWCGPV
ncbi:hypothetical protein K491DRAFT_782453 [Lophiostoma macrostomum CBS 122681]|uniref:Uncharacterized protein n=1 Tax=Lophiostoma macrostomum CBS 122681 TaxID=1314788 RepID=A0A6A6SSI5_9PLEO|nr:hypothetical protein K491DRAFT_782453 [Lophiostoma macrostomum CBS 122681]